MTNLELDSFSKSRHKCIFVKPNVKELLAVQKIQTQISQVGGTWSSQNSQNVASRDASVKFMWMGRAL